MNKNRIFSGIQPSGNLHIGNYIGAIQQWVKLQESIENDLIFCIVDLHAITVYQDPKVLKEKILETVALYISCGIDPEKSHIFIQSENPDHSYLAWILDCIIPIGWMNRMIQFKDKSKKQKELTSVGLFNYPALMAADILVYDTDLVPVGEDQKQHVELTCDIAERFNNIYKEKVFKLPKSMIDKKSARIMSLKNPNSKMSKSDLDPFGTINLLDTESEIEKKVKQAVTDSGTEISYRDDKPAISNLLIIYSKFSGKSISEIEEQYKGKSYAEFKEDLSQVLISGLKPIQEKYYKIRKDKDYLEKALDKGRDYCLEISKEKINRVKECMGLGR